MKILGKIKDLELNPCPKISLWLNEGGGVGILVSKITNNALMA